MTALRGGQVDVAVEVLSPVLPQIKVGKLRALGSTGVSRSPAAPDIPTIAEQGLRGFEAISWAGICAPGGTPKAIVDKVSRDVKTVLRNPEVNKQISDSLAEVIGSTPEEYDAFIRAEIKKWAEVIVKAKIKDD